MIAFLKAAAILTVLTLVWGAIDRRWSLVTGREQKPECGNCGCAAPCEARQATESPRTPSTSPH